MTRAASLRPATFGPPFAAPASGSRLGPADSGRSLASRVSMSLSLPALQVAGHGPGLGGNGRRIVRHHPGGLPAAGLLRGGGGGSPADQFGRESDPSAMGRDAGDSGLPCRGLKPSIDALRRNRDQRCLPVRSGVSQRPQGGGGPVLDQPDIGTVAVRVGFGAADPDRHGVPFGLLHVGGSHPGDFASAQSSEEEKSGNGGILQAPNPCLFRLLEPATRAARLGLQGHGDDGPDVFQPQSLGLAPAGGTGRGRPAHPGECGGGELSDRVRLAGPFGTEPKRGHRASGGGGRLPGLMEVTEVGGNQRVRGAAILPPKIKPPERGGIGPERVGRLGGPDQVLGGPVQVRNPGGLRPSQAVVQGVLLFLIINVKCNYRSYKHGVSNAFEPHDRPDGNRGALRQEAEATVAPPPPPVRDRPEAPWLPGSDSVRIVKERRSHYFAGAPSAFILDTITPGGGEGRSPVRKIPAWGQGTVAPHFNNGILLASRICSVHGHTWGLLSRDADRRTLDIARDGGPLYQGPTGCSRSRRPSSVRSLNTVSGIVQSPKSPKKS